MKKVTDVTLKRLIMRLQFWLFLLIPLLFVACEQEAITPESTSEEDPDSPSVMNIMFTADGTTGGNGMDSTLLECFEFVYPLTVTLPDSSILTLNDEGDWQVIEVWYQNNPNSSVEPMLIYPLDIRVQDSTGIVTQTINSDQELMDVILACDYSDVEGDWEYHEACYTFVYPLTVTMPDGSPITLLDEDDWENVEAWYDANPTEVNEPTLPFPLDLIDPDGNLLTVNDLYEMDAAFASCYSQEWIIECYEFVFPLTVILPDASTITLADEDDWGNVDAWYQANPTATGEPTLSYPIDLIDEDGNVETVTSPGELEALFESCVLEGEFDPCFELVFPITISMPDGTSVSVNDEAEMESAIEGWFINNPTSQSEPMISFPINILFDDGTTQAINSGEELHMAYLGC